MKDDILKKPITPPKRTERNMPTVYRYTLKVEWFRTFTFWQRLCILFGGNLIVQMGIATQHNAGAFQPLVLGKITKQRTPDARHAEIIDNMLQSQPTSAVQHEPKPNESSN